MKLTKYVAIIAIIVAIVAVGCRRSQAIPDDAELGSVPITLQFWNSWTGPDGDTLVAIVQEFNRTNPWRITIEMDIVAAPQLVAKLNTAFPTGEAAEILLQNTARLPVINEFLIPQDDIFVNTALREDQFLSGHLDGCKFEDTLYIIPFQFSGIYLYWNRDLFRRFGFDPERPPMNWEEYTYMAERMTDPANNIFGTALTITSAAQLNGVMVHAGGSAIIEVSPGRFRANFVGNQGYRDNLVWHKDLFDREIAPMGVSLDPAFIAGQVALLPNGIWTAAGADAAGVDFGIGKFFGNDARAGISGFVTTTSIKSEYARRAAQKFIEWWFTGNEGTNLARTGAGRWAFDIGFPASYLPLINSPEYRQNERLQALNPTSATLEGAMSPFTFFGNVADVTTALYQEVCFSPAQGAELQRVIDAALETAQRDAEAIIVQFHGANALVR